MSLPGHDDAPVQVDIAIQREMEYKTFLGDYSGSGVVVYLCKEADRGTVIS